VTKPKWVKDTIEEKISLKIFLCGYTDIAMRGMLSEITLNRCGYTHMALKGMLKEKICYKFVWF